MAIFDFVNGEDFRLSLESDYKELTLAMQNKAWKAAHLLAGSIIEAILVDYLVSLGQRKRLSFDPLKINLADAISECRKEGAISERTEHLSHVIRSYRNLIHPGRSVRLGETATENSAKVVTTLIDIIVEEITARKKQNYGYTAEQIITKLEYDSTAVAILEYLLKDTSEQEKERLLLEVIPKRYFDALNGDASLKNLLSSLISCFRWSFNAVSDEIKKKILKNFIKIIKEEKSTITWRYAFFRGEDLRFLTSEDAKLVKKHFLSILNSPLTIDMLRAMHGIGKFLTKEESIPILYHFINSLAFSEEQYIFEEVYNVERLINVLVSECYNMNADVLKNINVTLVAEYHDDSLNKRDKFAKVEKQLYKEIFGPEVDLITSTHTLEPLSNSSEI